MGFVVQRQQPRKIEAVDHFVQCADHRGDPLFHQRRKAGVGHPKAGGCHDLLLHAADPPIQNQGQRAALRLGLGGHIADQLLVGRQSLPTGALQAALRREVGVYHHEILRHHIVPDGLKQKALATAVFSHDEAEGRTSVGNDVHVPQQGVNFVPPPHGDVGQANAGNDAAFQGVYQRLSNSFWYFHG